MGQKFTRNCCISYGFRGIDTFSFSAKIQDGCQKWRKLKFFPSTLLYHPAGQKFVRNRSISYGFPDIDTFPFSAKIQDGHQKWQKLKLFPHLTGDSCTTLWVKNLLEIALSLMVFQILTLFIFRKNPRWPPKVAKIEIIPPFDRGLLYHPVGQKFARNRSISYGFQDIDTFSFSAKIQDGRQKWRKLKFSPFPQETLVPPCGSKIRLKSLYLLWFSRY